MMWNLSRAERYSASKGSVYATHFTFHILYLYPQRLKEPDVSLYYSFTHLTLSKLAGPRLQMDLLRIRLFEVV